MKQYHEFSYDVVFMCVTCGARFRDNAHICRECKKKESEMSEKLIINTDVELDLQPEAVAELFWNFNSDDQAKFFNSLGDNQQFQWQMNNVALSSDLSLSGAKAMTAIGQAIT